MLQTGAIITLARGAYRLREQLGSSAYGVVWRADAPWGGAVALKLINHTQMERAHPSLRQRWVDSADKEIVFLGSLEPWDERHVVRLLDQGRHLDLPVMALELMDTDLARHLAAQRAAGGSTSLDRTLASMAQVNQALAKVHQYGWLYLDLKPANLLLDGTGAIKLADFGTSRLRRELPAACYAGTASWQAPEQFFPTASQTWDTDTLTDYFALGALFYFLVTGGVQLRFCSNCGNAFRQHQAAGPRALLARHGGAIPPTLHDDEAILFAHRIDNPTGAGADATWCPAAPSAQAQAALALLRSLLAQEREQRPRHAIEISRMLDAVRRYLPQASPGRTTTPSASAAAGGRA